MQYEKNVFKDRVIICESTDIYVVTDKKRSLSDSIIYLKNKTLDHQYLSDKLWESESGDADPLQPTIGKMDNSTDELKSFLFTKNGNIHKLREAYESRRMELAFEHQNYLNSRWSSAEERNEMSSDVGFLFKEEKHCFLLCFFLCLYKMCVVTLPYTNKNQFKVNLMKKVKVIH